jgi:hypothetical protein
VSKPKVRKFKKGEVVGRIEDDFTATAIIKLEEIRRSFWNQIGMKLGFEPYDEALQGRGFSYDPKTREVTYFGKATYK